MLPAHTQLAIGPGPGAVTGRINVIICVDGVFWLGGSRGAFRVDRNSNETMQVSPDTGQVFSMISLGNDVWLGAHKGLFRVDRKTGHATLVSDHRGVVVVATVGGEVWFGDQLGVYRVDRKTGQDLWVWDTGPVYSIIPLGEEEVWIAGAMGAFRVNRNGSGPLRVSGNTGEIYLIAAVDDEVWLGAERGAFRVDRKTGHAARVGNTGSVFSIVPVGKELWFGTRGGITRFDPNDGQVIWVQANTGLVRVILPLGDEVWLGAQNGVFRVNRNSNEVMPVGGKTGDVSSMISLGDVVWLGADEGAFQVDPYVRITVKLAGEIPLTASLLGTSAWLEGDSYPTVHYVNTRTRRDSYQSSQPAWIKIVDDSDGKNLKEAMKDPNNWVPVIAKRPVIPLKPGRTKIHLAVWDSWGNKTVVEPVEGWVFPTWTLSSLLPILGIGICIVCFALAPYVRYCHLLLMNPFLRNWVSFGTVPLLLTTVPPLRRYIFLRYRHGLASDPTLQTSAGRYVVPDDRFSPSEFGDDLREKKVIGLHGESGIGKSALLAYLAHECAVPGHVEHPLLRRLVPVLVDLSITGDTTPEAMVRTKLEKYGDLTDDKLTGVLLDHGDFMFLFDGLNEVSNASMKAIIDFVDKHRNHSYACLTTQAITEELKKTSTLVAASALSEDKIKELVRLLSTDADTKKGNFDPEALLTRFSDETYRLSRVPLQLELIVEMWEQTAKVPSSLDDLYSYFLGPMLDRNAWGAKGHADYPDILSQLAFNMMTGKRPYDPSKDYLPEELKTELISRKLLLERSGVLEFRHDRIRAYLAARHFTARWRAILVDRKNLVDHNWDVMLQFHIAKEQDPAQAKALLFLLLARDMDVAIHLSYWGQKSRPGLFSLWQDDFNREVGKKIVGESAPESQRAASM